ARSFLNAHRALLRVDDPDQELRLVGQQRDEIGQRHLRFAQMFHDLPVWPAGLSVHLDAKGNLNLVDGAYIPTPNGVATQPVINVADAVERAKASVPGGKSGEAKDTTL